MLTTLLDLVAAGLVVAGVAMLSVPVALIVAGVLVGVVSYLEPWRAEA